MAIVDPASLPYALFLLVAACANLPFLIRCVLDLVSPTRLLKRSMPSAPPALFTTAFAELCWVVPCLIQCSLAVFNGAGAWSSNRHKTACDVQGFYAIFASIAGMSSTLWIAYITWHASGARQISARASTAAGVCIIIGSLLVASLPLMGVGVYEYLAGFCYFSYHQTAHAVILLVIPLPIVFATVAMLALAARRGGWPSNLDLLLVLLSFLSAWTLWLPASFIGLGGGTFPRYYFVTAGVSGHAQALINPFVYGILWRRSALRLQLTSGSKTETVDDPVIQVDATPPSPVV